MKKNICEVVTDTFLVQTRFLDCYIKRRIGLNLLTFLFFFHYTFLVINI